MASRVVQTQISLHLDEAGHPAVRAHQQFAEKGAGYIACVTGEELPRQQKSRQSPSGSAVPPVLAGSGLPWS